MVDLASVALQFEFLAFGGLFCAIAIAFFILWIFVMVWVYRDAESRGMTGVLWILVVFFLGLIGLIIYLVVRGSHPVRAPGMWPPPPGTYPPPAYGPPPPMYGPPPAAYSPPPVQAPAAAGKPCKECGSPLPPGAMFCSKCGTKQ